MVNILTDSTSDLDRELATRFDVRVLPVLVFIDNRTFRDGVEINTPQLFALIKKTGQLPKTAAVSMGDYLQFFDLPGESIYITASSRLSACYQNAHLAACELPPGKVRMIDSLNVSTAISLLVLKAAELRDQGLSAAEIEQQILTSIPKVRTSFIIETMEYLYKGGRCTALQAIMGSMLKIRPMIEVRPDGTTGVKEKTRGSRQKSLEALLVNFKGDLPQMNRERMFITHTGCDEDARMLAREVQRLAEPNEVFITIAGSAIASHCGPDAIGILYMLK